MYKPDNTHVRRDFTCPLCLGVKNGGLVLCWDCHYSEKQANDGCYSDFAERRIAARDDYLRNAVDRYACQWGQIYRSQRDE